MSDDRDICERLEDTNYDGALFMRQEAAKDIRALRYYAARLEDELARAEIENARLREALKTNMAIIERAQDVLCEQLMGPPRGLSDHTALNKLHRLLDGPEQREALGQARAALAEPEKK